ncbi:hypothetical protein L3X38_023282 [Prunus dulcis]|uniref:Uncharacterized protein n=1 Tax=Prunus dulcis TaxID=3755 RepID=A0AAD4W0A9_PRUDU|nr:hypothetical protein L3X38_023282 [Prunus dulcis]
MAWVSSICEAVFPVGNHELRPRARLVRTEAFSPSRRRLRRPNPVIEVFRLHVLSRQDPHVVRQRGTISSSRSRKRASGVRSSICASF